MGGYFTIYTPNTTETENFEDSQIPKSNKLKTAREKTNIFYENNILLLK